MNSIQRTSLLPLGLILAGILTLAVPWTICAQSPLPPPSPERSAGSFADSIQSFETQFITTGDEPLEPPPEPDPLAPGLGVNFSGITFDSESTSSGFYHIPPDPHGAVGSNHVVSVVNSSIRWHTKAGVQQNSQRLGKNSSTFTGSFFATLSPTNGTFDAKVIYDQYAGRFLVVTLERTDTASGDAANTSRILLAVSDDNDPNGTWYYFAINSRITISGNNTWADYPGIAVDEEAIYVTGNMFTFGASGSYLGSRLWIIPKTSFYSGGAASSTIHNPYSSVGIGNGGTLMPAHVFGAGGAGATVGTFFANVGWSSGATDQAAIIRVDNPLTSPTFANQFISFGDIHNTGVTFPSAPQLGSANNIDAGGNRVYHAVWRSNRLYFVSTIVPPSGPDAGQATAHYYVINTANTASLTLADQGNIGGEDIAAGTHTFYPSIAVDNLGNLGIGFAASGAGIFPGAYYTGRLATDTPGTVQPSAALKVGVDYYYRAFGGTRNRWGDYSGTSLDPSNERTMWLFNEYAMSRGTVLGSYPTEDGRWATWWGNFTLATNISPVIANFTGTPTNGLAPLVVTFTNLTTGATSYSWNFGDATASTNQHPLHTYTNAGYFTVTLTAIGLGGTNALTITNYITATNYPPVIANFSAEPTNGLAPLTITFTNLSANATNYSWDFGDGNASTNQHPLHTFTNAGSFTVTLTAIGLGGTNALTITNYITATNYPPVIANFSAEPTNGLAPLTVTFTNLSANATEFAWDFGDATVSTNQHPLHTFTNAGSFTVTLTAIGLGGTNALTFTNYITVTNAPPPPAPVANFIADITAGLAPLTVNFTNLSANATNYAWTFGDGNITTNEHPANTFTNAGTFSVSLEAIGAGGTNIVTFTNYITVTNAPPPPAPVANFTADITAGLAPLTVNFTNLSANATNYAWTFGDGNITTNEHPSNTFTNAGTFSVSLEAIGAGGTNIVTFTNYITVTNAPPPPAPVANFTADITAGLAPLTVNFTNLSANATNYAWTFGDGNISTNEHPPNTFTNAGSFTVTLTAIGLGGTNALTFTNYITVTNAPPPPAPVANFTADITAGLAPLTVNFTNLSANAANYAWTFGDGNITTNEHPANTFTNAGSFSVTLEAIGAGGTNIVTFTNYITVTNLPPLLVVTPTSINLGTVLTGAWSHASFTISNAGGLLLNANATITTDPFFLLDANTNPVVNVAFTVPTLASTNIAVRFQPLTEGAFSNVVVFVTDGGSSTNVITGFGFGTPVIVQLTSSATEFTFSFATVPGKIYEVQYKDTLDAALWQTLQFVPGDGSLKTITNLTTAPAERYYRLSVP